MSRALLCALVGATLLPCPAFAGILLPKEPGATPLKVRKQSIEVQVKDQVARATVDEVFENFTDQPLEGTYLLPLPDGAAVSGFATWVDGQKVESRVQEKQKAEQTYQQAKAESAAPAMLEQTDASTFKTRVDGIPAHGTKRVEASFAQILPYDGGVVTLRLPMSVKGKEGSETVGDFHFAALVGDQKKITDLQVTSHPAKVTRVSATSFKVELDAQNVRPASELVLTYRTESSRLGLSFVPFRPDAKDDGYFLLLASPQELTTAADIVNKDVVFVFDTSGSMASEDKIGQARAALKKCLSNLNAEDNFAIVAFSDAMNPFKNKLVPASKAQLAEAMAFADKLGPGGGTNISGALLEGLRMLDGSARPRVLIFMTDGIPSAGVTDPNAIAELVKARTNGARLFSFGVGSDLNRTLLERLGQDNRGSHDFVERGQTIEQVVGTFYAKISKPVLSDLSFDFGEVTTAMQYPDVLPDLYKGSQLVLVGRYRNPGKVQAKLVGQLNGQKHAIPFEASFPDSEQDNAFVARLWAQRRIDYLLSQNRLNGEREEAKAEIIRLSTAYNIVTPYTAMVAVKTTPNALAMVSPARVKPGDPVIRIAAPRDAKAVRVSIELPGTVIHKKARWDEREGAWMARFLVPAGTPDGSYPIDVEIDDCHGDKRTLALEIRIDTQAPAIEASASAAKPGAPLTLAAHAVVGARELAETLLRRDDKYEAVKSLFDVRRVTARLWDGREVELHLDPRGLGFVAEAETNSTLSPGSYEVVFTALDFAGNSARTTATVEVR